MNRVRSFFQKLNSNPQISIVEYLLMFFFIFMSFYYAFASYALENMNEGLYAEIPREMLLTGNYIIPHLNFVPYLEKPPFLYWLIALSYHLFGVSAFSARLVPVTAAASTCLALFFFAKAIRLTKEGWIAAIVLATTIGFILVSRVIIFDMVLTSVFSLSLFFFYLWYQKESRYYLWLSYAFLALAFMTKGLLAVALIPTIAMLFMLVNKTEWRKIFKIVDIAGILIFLLLTVPWLVLATLKQPGFAWDFFINEQVLRFLNKRVPYDYHHGAIYYYIIPLIVIMLPWSVFLPSLLVKEKVIEPKAIQLKRFLWLWFLIPFIFFSFSQAKAQYYIIIGVPPLTLLLALKINKYFSLENNKTIFRGLIGLLIAGVIFLAIACVIFFNPHIAGMLHKKWHFPPELAQPLLRLLIVFIIYGFFACLINYYFPIPLVQFLLIAGIMISPIFFYVTDKQALQSARSEVALGNYISQHDSNRPVYLYKDYENFSTIIFYGKKRMAIIDSVSKDLYYGSTTPAAKSWFISTNEFIPQAKRQPIYVVSFTKYLTQFKSAIAPLNFCVVASSKDVVLMSNEIKDCAQ